MRLTASLAYSQIKNNHTRTILTIVGIVLSTTLLTTVCSLVASVNAAVVEILGEGGGEYNGMLAGLLLPPAVILCAIIVLMSIVVISNTFRVSAAERRAQFGILKSVGATKRQIISTVMYESIWYSAIGVPMGIIVGLLLAFGAIQIINHFLGEINSLAQVMIQEFSIVVPFTIAWQAIMITALLSFATILLSAWQPARKAARITAIESIRGLGEIKKAVKQKPIVPAIQNLLGFEGVMAVKNVKRNRRNFRASVISLTVGMILFICLASLGKQAGQMEELIYGNMDAAVMVDYVSSQETTKNQSTGRSQTKILAPVSTENADQITEQLRQYQDTKIFGCGYDTQTYEAIVSEADIDPRMLAVIKEQFPQMQTQYRLAAEIVVVDPQHYSILCEKAGVLEGENILINYYKHNDNGNAQVLTPFLYKENELSLIQADDRIQKIKIGGVLLPEDVPNELLGVNTNMVRVIVPKGDVRGYMWYADPVDSNGFMEYANQIMEEAFPRSQEDSYMEAGFTTRVFKSEDYVRVMNIAIVMAEILVYSFVVLLMLIGLTSIISAISTNVRMRSREFAMLQSVGMTRKGLNRMLSLENILCSMKALVIGIPMALILTYIINLPIRKAFPIPYQLPWIEVLLCAGGIFIITTFAIQYSSFQLRDKNIIETIRGID